MSIYTPNQESRIPFDSSERYILAEFIEIHQPNLEVLEDETVELTCDIQYAINIDQKSPNIFWFEDIHNVKYSSQ